MASRGTAVFLLLALTVSSSLGKPAVLTTSWEDMTLNRAEGCLVGSMSCAADCASVQLCTAGGYIPFETCQSDEICDALSLTCKPITTGQCTLPSEYKFKCNSPGAFPDPFDCHAHHYCASLPNGTLVNLEYQCEDSSAYDPLTTLCLLTDDDRVCREGPIPACESAGQTGPQVENPNIYYICVRNSNSSRVEPWLFRCPRDTDVFDGVQCVPRDSTTSTTSLPTSTTPTTTPPTSTTPTTTPPTSTTPTTTPPTWMTTSTTWRPTETTEWLTTTTPWLTTTTTPTTTTDTTTTSAFSTTSTPPFTTVASTTNTARVPLQHRLPQ